MKRRNVYWQIIRGVCISAVVLIHCPNPLLSENRLDYNTWLILRQLIDFPVPVFIFMAGFFVNTDKCLENPFNRIKKRRGGIVNPISILDNCIFSDFIISQYEYTMGENSTKYHNG